MSSAARYYPRAPRYVYRPDDQSLMRFAGMETRGITSRARVRDLSFSGMSFTVKSTDAPRRGDMIKVEFGVPGQKQIAWFATVVRIERRSDWDPEFGRLARTVVAIQFRQLPPPFTRTIHKSIGRLIGMRERGDESVFNFNARSSTPIKDLAVFSALSGLLLAAFVGMAVPPDLWLRPFHSLFQ